ILEALFSCVACAGHNRETGIYTDMKRLPGATVAVVGPDRAEPSSFLNWLDHVEHRSRSPQQAGAELVATAEQYLGPIVSHVGNVSCFLSSGSDSAFVAGLVPKRYGPAVIDCYPAGSAPARASETHD